MRGFSEKPPCVSLRNLERQEIPELPAEIWLFQGLPKGDKLEWIIEKAVELGAHAVVPVRMQNCVVRLDPKKAEQKGRRWQMIAEADARQSKRSLIPEVRPDMSWAEALAAVRDFDYRLVPYENADGIARTRELLSEMTARLPAGNAADRETRRLRIAVFIGPEGGISPGEIEEAMQAGLEPITLGRRILRTETAAAAMLSLLMIALEH